MQSTTQSRLLGVVIALVVVASITASTGAISYIIAKPSETIPMGVYIAGVHVGRLTPDEARFHIENYVNSLVTQPITVSVGEDVWTVPTDQLGVTLRLDETFLRAASVAQDDSFWMRTIERFRIARQGMSIPVVIDLDEGKLSAWFDKIARQYEREPQNARIVTTEGGIEIVPSKMGYRLERQGAKKRVRQAVLRPDFRHVNLPLAEISPTLTTAQLGNVNIHRPMGLFSTRFNPSDQNRTENIRIAARALDGLLLAPGEEFSFNERVGPRIEAKGYKEAPVIIDGELVPDIGGGVCQVSSTLYNAVLLAGLHVSHRYNHSLPSTYVPLGQDAAVAYDYIDFRFRNNAENYVLVRSWVDEDEITVAFFGTPLDQRRVYLESEVVRVIEPQVIEKSTPSLAPGERRTVQQGRRGYHVNVWRVAQTSDGYEERTLVSRSSYRARDQIVWVGESRT